jgi:hypothetical protein
MRYDVKLIYKDGDESVLEKVIFNGRYEIRKDEIDLIYDSRFANQLASNVPEYMYNVGIQNIIKNVWKN